MIYIANQLFRASTKADYAKALDAAGWRKIGDEYVTSEIEQVLPFIQFLDPAVVELLGATGLEAKTPNEIIVKEGAPSLYDFQKEDVQFILDREHTLLAEDAGLGKTAIMLTAANTMKAKTILILCPAIAKYNWSTKEIPKWLAADLTVGIAEGDYWPDNTDIVIINYDIVLRHKKKIQERMWDLFICDESHRLNNKDARRTRMVIGGRMKMKQAVAELCGAVQDANKPTYYTLPAINARKWVWATATPMNTPKNLWVVCQKMDPKGLGANWMNFHRRYCAAYRTPFGWDINGADNQKELGARLRESFMIRHENPIELPPFREQVFLLPPVEIVLDMEESFVHDNVDALRTLAKQANKDFNPDDTVSVFKLLGDVFVNSAVLIGKPEFKPLFSKYAEMREKTGLAKVPHVIEFLKMRMGEDGERPVVCFAYHRSVIAKLLEAFPNAAYIIGGMPSKKRNDMVDAFQAKTMNPFIGNIDAAGEAVTLTVASYACFAEVDWRATALIQARKRVHRISQIHPVSVDYLCSARSFDAYVADTAIEKMKNIAVTIEGSQNAFGDEPNGSTGT